MLYFFADPFLSTSSPTVSRTVHRESDLFTWAAGGGRNDHKNNCRNSNSTFFFPSKEWVSYFLEHKVPHGCIVFWSTETAVTGGLFAFSPIDFIVEHCRNIFKEALALLLWGTNIWHSIKLGNRKYLDVAYLHLVSYTSFTLDKNHYNIYRKNKILSCRGGVG